MSRTVTPEKARLVAEAYISGGCESKGRAMKDAGYSANYADSGKGQAVFDNPLVKAEIAAIQARNAEKCDRTIAGVDAMYQRAYDLAEGRKNPAAMVQASTGIARLYGMDKDATAVTEEVKELAESEARAAKLLAYMVTEFGDEIQKVLDRQEVDPAYEVYFELTMRSKEDLHNEIRQQQRERLGGPANEPPRLTGYGGTGY